MIKIMIRVIMITVIKIMMIAIIVLIVKTILKMIKKYNDSNKIYKDRLSRTITMITIFITRTQTTSATTMIKTMITIIKLFIHTMQLPKKKQRYLNNNEDSYPLVQHVKFPETALSSQTWARKLRILSTSNQTGIHGNHQFW